jgi:hypothetical protein
MVCLGGGRPEERKRGGGSELGRWPWRQRSGVRVTARMGAGNGARVSTLAVLHYTNMSELVEEHAQEVGVRAGHERHIRDTRQPQGHFAEHLAGSEWGKVGCHFGLLLDRIWRWAKN